MRRDPGAAPGTLVLGRHRARSVGGPGRSPRARGATRRARAAGPELRSRPPPPPPARTNRTRRVPHPVLIGHARAAGAIQNLSTVPGMPRPRRARATPRPRGKLSSGGACRAEARWKIAAEAGVLDGLAAALWVQGHDKVAPTRHQFFSLCDLRLFIERIYPTSATRTPRRRSPTSPCRTRRG